MQLADMIHDLPARVRSALPRDLTSRGIAPMEIVVGLFMLNWGLSGIGVFGPGPLYRSLLASGYMVAWGALLCTIATCIVAVAACDALCGRHWSDRAVMRSAWLRAWLATLAIITWVWVANSLLKTGAVSGVGALYGHLPVFLLAHAWAAGQNILVKVVADDRIETVPGYRLKR